MAEITLKKAETELAKLKDSFELANTRIMGNGGQKSQLWLFKTRHRIYDLEEKIEDMKAGRVRTDELIPEELTLEKRLGSLEKNVKNITQGGREPWL